MRRRIIALSLFLSLVLFVSVQQADRQVRQVIDRAQNEITVQQDFSAGMGRLENTVYIIESGLYRYAIMQDNAARFSVEHQLREIEIQLGQLERSALLRHNPSLREDFHTL